MKTVTTAQVVAAADALAETAATRSRRLDHRATSWIVARRHPRDWTRADLARLLDVPRSGRASFDELAAALGL